MSNILYRVGNNLTSELASAVATGASSMAITAGDGAKIGTEISRLYGSEKFPYFITIWSSDYSSPSSDANREIVKVTARTDDTLDITRGQRGTSAQEHSSGDNVILGAYADEIYDIQNALKEGLRDPEWTTPAYASATTFTVVGDITSEAKKGRILKITFAVSGVKICTIQSASYSSPNTTITVSGESLVNETIDSVEMDLSSAYVDSADKKGVISGCSVYMGSAQTFTHNVATLINFDTENYDALGEFDTSAKRFTCTKPGRYAMYVQIRTAEGDDLSQTCEIKKNGTVLALGKTRGANPYATVNTYIEVEMAVDDYIEFWATYYNYTDAGNVSIYILSSSTFATISKIA